MSTPLTFGELEVGDHYVAFPRDGDDSGHGGYRGEHYVFKKTGTNEGTRLWDGVSSSMYPASHGMHVVKVGFTLAPAGITEVGRRLRTVLQEVFAQVCDKAADASEVTEAARRHAAAQQHVAVLEHLIGFREGDRSGCGCTECLLRRAIERVTEENVKLRAERDELEAEIVGLKEGARSLREEMERRSRS